MAECGAATTNFAGVHATLPPRQGCGTERRAGYPGNRDEQTSGVELNIAFFLPGDIYPARPIAM
ncbi:MAG: hypothetical protein NVSMB52_06680 [Chloroflexota bacterium]